MIKNLNLVLFSPFFAPFSFFKKTYNHGDMDFSWKSFVLKIENTNAALGYTSYITQHEAGETLFINHAKRWE